MNIKIDEQFVGNKIVEFMINKENGNWHEEKVEKSDLHKHGKDKDAGMYVKLGIWL